MNVAIVTVGDELLAGETINTNAAWIAERLTDRGATVERVVTVPDRVADIARVVNEYRAEYDAVVVTGGLGPTHDDCTIEGVGAAFGKPLESNPAVAKWLDENGEYAGDELVAGTTELPAGAEPLHNEVGVAPGCVINEVYVLPGVPEEMKAMFATVADRFVGTTTHVATVTVDEPESELLGRFDQLREQFDVTVGSYPGEVVTVKIRGIDPDSVDRAAEWFSSRVNRA
ncbi:competence/damage-inducible protein A [Halocatena halophila]|uniref:competence/damage-inducible protein A n=1 Tax=Halocatena halophila TaxID=2814576 RepID=UPI002ED31D36